MVRQRLISYYSIILGFGIAGLWMIILKNSEIQEGKTEMVFHLLSEFLMAAICILSGFKLLMRHKSAVPVNIIGHSMIIYSVLNAAGYYAERGEILVMVIFLALLLISTTIIFYCMFHLIKISRW